MPVIVQGGGAPRVVVVERARTVQNVVAKTTPVQVADARHVEAVRDRTQTLAVAAPGPQGPQGEQGPPGPAGGATFTRVAAQALGGHRIVRSAGAGTVDYADSTNLDHGDDTLGMTTGAADAGASVTVQAFGPIEFNGWSWTPNEPVFLGASGLPTQTPPSDGFTQQIGHAESATSIYLQIKPPIY